MEAEVIDIAWYSLASGMDQRQRPGSEEGFAAVARDAQAMANVICSFRRAERRQAAQNGDSLTQLNHIFACQFVGQLRLAGEEDLHELCSRDFEVGQHSYRFQHRVVEVLRFINHNDNAPASAQFLDQKVIQLAVYPPKVILFDIDP